MNANEFAEFADEALSPGRFWVGSGLSLRRVPARFQRRRWELLRGELVPQDQTREEAEVQQATLHAELPGYPNLGPMLTLVRLANEGQVHLLRGFAVHGHEAYGEGNVIQTRPAVKWHEERVATFSLDSAYRMEWLNRSLRDALLGTSRLAITSVESPHPFYSFGLLAVASSAAPGSEPATGLAAWLSGATTFWDFDERLDAALRIATDSELPLLHDWLSQAPALSKKEDRGWLLYNWFNRLALTPAVGQARRMLKLLEVWLPPEEYAARLARWLRQLAWHVTAFDLSRFHNQGANYPDALFLDDLLQRLVEPATAGLVETARLHSALRLGSWCRRHWEGLPVPARPTSPGENIRVSPLGDSPLPESELLEPARRENRLFTDQPYAQAFAAAQGQIHQAWAALAGDEELLELGRATFLDRPLGIFKEFQGVRRDETPLAAYRAVSKQTAARRLQDAADWGWLPTERTGELKQRLKSISLHGVAAIDLPLPRTRLGVVCLEDANRVAPDFVFTHYSLSAEVAFITCIDLSRALAPEVSYPDLYRWLIIRSPRPRLFAEPRAVFTFYDEQRRPRLELGLPEGARPDAVRYVEDLGRGEVPVCSFEVLHAWNADGVELKLGQRHIYCPPANRPGGRHH